MTRPTVREKRSGIKICPNCKRPFKRGPKANNALKYCSPECSKEAEKVRYHRRKLAAPEYILRQEAAAGAKWHYKKYSDAKLKKHTASLFGRLTACFLEVLDERGIKLPLEGKKWK